MMSTVAAQFRAELASATESQSVMQITSELRRLLADVFVLYIKTKNFHWHVGGPHFRDLHLLLDEQASQVLAMTDEIAERARKLGGTTLHSIGEITREQRLRDNDNAQVPAKQMIAELNLDNRALAGFLRTARQVCEQYRDFATISLIDPWIDQTERRAWFLAQHLLEV